MKAGDLVQINKKAVDAKVGYDWLLPNNENHLFDIGIVVKCWGKTSAEVKWPAMCPWSSLQHSYYLSVVDNNIALTKEDMI